METTAAESDDSSRETPSVFACLTLPPYRSRINRTAVVAAVLALFTLCVAGVFLARPIGRPENSAPRVEVEVEGMHCPIRCGMKVAAALETLPWVVPGSTTANPKTGRVTFAVTSREAVDPGDVTRVIEHAGFPVRSIRK